MSKRRIAIAVGVLVGLATGPALAASYAAGGTHQCSGQRKCVVSISNARDCVSASDSLRARDCCPSTRGGHSVGFSMQYCIPGR